jgi:CheY-like chemotaxis protein
MLRSGPIIYVEDDIDDQELFTEAIEQLKVPNEVRLIANGNEALAYLRTTSEQPFIIFCDINLPQLDGLEFRREIINDAYLLEKSIPFIYLTTTASKAAVKQAYLMNVQGFFVKPQNFAELMDTLKDVVEYWNKCKHPNSGDT